VASQFVFRPGKAMRSSNSRRGLEHGFVEGKRGDGAAATADKEATLTARRVEEEAAHFARQVDRAKKAGGVEQSEGARNGGWVALCPKFRLSGQRFPRRGLCSGGEASKDPPARRREAQSQLMTTRQHPRAAGLSLRMGSP
jgi:hypothetical protein